MKVPLLDLRPIHEPIQDQLLNAAQRTLLNQSFILGPEVEALEREISVFCHTPQAIGVSSGTDALLVTLMAMGIGPEDEVITTPYSFFATAGIIARLGARPVFVDIDRFTYNLQPAHLESAITTKTRAVIAVHLFGQCADMPTLSALCRKHRLFLVEDAAQSLGATSHGQKAGSLGDAGCFSFFPSKNLGGCGDGGMVTTTHSDLAEKIRILRVHGSSPKYFHKWVGGNFRLDALQAALLRVKLPHLNTWNHQRQENAVRYQQLFSAAGLLAGGQITLPSSALKSSTLSDEHIYNQYVIRATQRDLLLQTLHRHEIGAEIYYPRPLHLQECFASLGYRAGEFPEAEKAALETLALPVYPGLTEAMQRYVVQTIADFYNA